jgi:hypothetical protein
MPKHNGEFYPHSYCTVASGDCFTMSRCLGSCTAKQKRSVEQRIEDLESRVRQLEKALLLSRTYER